MHRDSSPEGRVGPQGKSEKSSPEDSLLAELRAKIDPNRFDRKQGASHEIRKFVAPDGTTIRVDKWVGGWSSTPWHMEVRRPQAGFVVGSSGEVDKSRETKDSVDSVLASRDGISLNGAPVPAEEVKRLADLLRTSQKIDPGSSPNTPPVRAQGESHTPPQP